MTESENSQPQDDSDEDIYKDIPEFNFEEELAKLEGSKETYKQEASDLFEKVKALTEENKELKKSNEVLKKNLSTLLKTAQAEVQRKDSMIEELRTEVESFTFRRNKNITKDKYTSTEDLGSNSELQLENEKQKSVSDTKKTKPHENRTSSDSDRKFLLGEDKRKSSSRKDYLDCDNDRKSNYMGNSKTDLRHSDGSHDIYNNERHRERKPGRYENSSGYRRPYREDNRDHLKYDSFDKKRHSRSSDSRFLSRHRNLRERRDDRRRGDSSEKRRSHESPERLRRRNSRKDRSRSREISRGSKESSFEKPKSRSSFDKDSAIRIKEQTSTKPEVPDSVKSSIDVAENKKRIENFEKRISLDKEMATGVRNKQVMEKRSGKYEKQIGVDIFSAKSPLDALYNDMVSSRSSNHFTTSKSGTTLPESDLEDGELSTTVTPNERQNTSESQPKEDWTLSFKNERKNEIKPMTLYSRRMMQKFSSEVKNKENKESVLKKEKVPENKKVEKTEEVEKEPGELTDDENIIESSKEFQELTKVASIESELVEKSTKEKTFKEPDIKEISNSVNPKFELVPKGCSAEMETQCTKEESNSCKEIEQIKDINEVLEFSPFKNNYKLIEISPIKRSGTEHVLDYYHQRQPPNPPPEINSINLSEGKSSSDKSSLKASDTSEEKDSWKNSSSEKEFETDLKIIVPSLNESPKGDDKKLGKKEEKESRKNKSTEDKKLNTCEEKTNTRKLRQRSISNQEAEKSAVDSKSQKRKRKSSETDLEKTDVKKRKTKESESHRKSTPTKRNTKSEPDSKPETEKKDDISSFEFFKPAAKTEKTVDVEKSICTTTDYKMTTTMSVTGVVCLETPDKSVEKVKNLIINEHMILNVMEPKNNSQFSPLIGSKCIEMTPRRMLKNDLMLTDSEDDSTNKRNEEVAEGEETIQEEMEMEEEDEEEISGSENSECDSDSGASDFVDLL